jgi:hypothetical protein
VYVITFLCKLKKKRFYDCNRSDDIQINIADIVIIVAGTGLFLAWAFLL